MLPLEKRVKIKETLSNCKAKYEFENLGYEQDFLIDVLGTGQDIVRYINKEEDVEIMVMAETKELLIQQKKRE